MGLLLLLALAALLASSWTSSSSSSSPPSSSSSSSSSSSQCPPRPPTSSPTSPRLRGPEKFAKHRSIVASQPLTVAPGLAKPFEKEPTQHKTARRESPQSQQSQQRSSGKFHL